MSSFWNRLKERRRLRKQYWNGFMFHGDQVLTDELERNINRTMTESNRLHKLCYSRWV